MADAYVIWHNPKCSTSRFVLGALRDAGVLPVVRDYLSQPPSATEIRAVLAASGLSARDLLRKRNTPYEELGLGDKSLDDDHLIAAMASHPALIERPVVMISGGHARLCRPKETVFEILPAQII